MESQGNSTPEKELLNEVETTSNEVTTVSATDQTETTQEVEVESLNDQTEAIVNMANSFEEKSKEDLIEYLAAAIQNHTVSQLKKEVEAIKIAFYKNHNADIEAEQVQFYNENPEDAKFTPTEDKFEVRLKELLTLYRTKRDQFVAANEAQKEANYRAKLQIVEALKELTNSNETLHNTFEAFRELQNRWKDIGLVPQAQVRDLWETYNHHVEMFYSYIKINKELRDLDWKKNYEAKIDLCEQAEALALENSAVSAFQKLQKLHEQWAQIGPVAIEFKEVLWERFKTASTIINKRHQDHFDEIRNEQIGNLTIKEGLCEQIETFANEELNSKNDWDKASERIIEIQKVWKSVGFAPKKDNNAIYERFRTACDKFFERKREFFDQVKGHLSDNYQAKLDLCVQAEAMADNTMWKQTTEEIINLQKRWKEIGATSRKHSEEVWIRFRSACDKFFEAKAKHFEESNSEFAKNLDAKLAMITEIESVNKEELNFDALKEIQRRWSAIGFVPMKKKEEINAKYKTLIDGLFDSLRKNESGRRIDQFKNRVAGMTGRGDGERERLYSRVKAIESEIQTLENNIGFFGRSKGAEAMIKEVQNKIDRAKNEITELVEKITIIDNN